MNLIPKIWEYAAVLVIVGLFSAWVYYEGGVGPRAELSKERAAHLAFVNQVKALGDAQDARTKSEDAKNQKRKEQSDVEIAKVRRDRDLMYDAYRRLRDQRANSGSGSGLLPETSPGSESPERACFDRSRLDRALSRFDQGVTDLLERGDKAIDGLNSAKRWAQP